MKICRVGTTHSYQTNLKSVSLTKTPIIFLTRVKGAEGQRDRMVRVAAIVEQLYVKTTEGKVRIRQTIRPIRYTLVQKSTTKAGNIFAKTFRPSTFESREKTQAASRRAFRERRFEYKASYTSTPPSYSKPTTEERAKYNPYFKFKEGSFPGAAPFQKAETPKTPFVDTEKQKANADARAFISEKLEKPISASASDHEILGVSKDASQTEIRTAYKKLAVKVHPDKNGGNPNAGNAFKLIQEAHQRLII